jgi:hypothetical protein
MAMETDQKKLMIQNIGRGLLFDNSRALAGALRIPLMGTTRLPDGNSALGRMLEGITQNLALMRSAIGPLADMRAAGLLDHSSALVPKFDITLGAVTEWQARFRLPDITELTRLMADFQTIAASDVLKRYAEGASGIQRAMERMSTPWLDAQESMRSIAGFAALQGIGRALSRMPSFGDQLGSTLRADLGDWRDTITFPNEVFTNLAARSDFYVKLGFNPVLTDFPAAAFVESLEIADLRHDPPAAAPLRGSPVPVSRDAREETHLHRTNTAHYWLLRLERQLRRFIDEKMTTAFGLDWPKHRLPNPLYGEWLARKQTARRQGSAERPLIDYADFTDYEKVICRRDNWKIFKPHFCREESVRESLQRLYPIRLDTMHARPITQDDELFLYVEARRLSKVIIGNTP